MTKVNYFKSLAEETGIPYQSLINLYLQDCVKTKRKPLLEWISNAVQDVRSLNVNTDYLLLR